MNRIKVNNMEIESHESLGAIKEFINSLELGYKGVRIESVAKEELTTPMDTTNEQLEILKKENQELKDLNDGISDENERMLSQINDLESKNKQIENENKNLNKENKSLRDKITQLEEEIKSLKTKNETLSPEHLEIKNDIEGVCNSTHVHKVEEKVALPKMPTINPAPSGDFDPNNAKDKQWLMDNLNGVGVKTEEKKEVVDNSSNNGIVLTYDANGIPTHINGIPLIAMEKLQLQHKIATPEQIWANRQKIDVAPEVAHGWS